jgi:adenosine deaminase
MNDGQLLKYIEKMPKIELHLHLEGSIHPATAFELIKKNNPENAPSSVESVKDMYRFGNLTEFIYGMRSVTDNITSIKDLQNITSLLFEMLVKENIVYVEYDCAFQKYINLGFNLEDIINALWDCGQEYEEKFGLMSKLVVNSQRSHGAESVESLAKKIISLKHPYVVGFGLSGDESKYPQKLYVDAFQRLYDNGIHRTVHAGEGAGPESIWDAIKLLKAERIDHGTRAVEDEKLVEFLIKSEIPLTQCLTSNLKLHVVQDFDRHPFGSFLNRNVIVSLSTDDPAIFDSSLKNEYLIAAKNFDLTINDFDRLSSNALKSTFLNESEKNKLQKRIHFDEELAKKETTQL